MATGEKRFRFKHDGQARRYLVHVPANYDRQREWPVVVLLHGAGGTARWTLLETGMAEKADQAGFLLVLPEGLPPEPAKAAMFLYNPPSWNDGSGYWSSQDDVGYIEEVLKDLPRHFSIDDTRIYLTGFSNGASFSFRLACELPDTFAALAPIAGHCFLENPVVANGIPTLYTVGDQDPLIPMNGGTVSSPWGFDMVKPTVEQTWQRWAKAIGCDTNPQESTRFPGVVTYEYPAQSKYGSFICHVIQGHGHHWPGGRAELKEKLAGPIANTWHANDELWNFFQKHQRS